MKLLFVMNNIIKKYQILILSVVYYIYLEGRESMKYKGGECGGETWRGDREGMKDITIS